MQAAFSTVFAGKHHRSTICEPQLMEIEVSCFIFKRDFKTYTFTENILGIDLVGRTMQFNNLNNLFSRHNRKWASLFLWNKFKCSGMNLSRNLRVLGLHQLRTTALQYTECTASTQAVDVRYWRG